MINKIIKIPFAITNEDRQKYIDDIENLFAKDDWCKDVPFYQTWPVLFDRKEKHWIDIKERILSINSLLNPECRFSRSWAYVSFVGKKGSLGREWHEHATSNAKISCLIYLQVGSMNDGTMFDLGDTILIPKVDLNTIYVYDSQLLHTPTYWDYENATKNRIVLAIDAW